MIMDIEQVAQYLPHRYPFLLVDRVIEMELGKRITAIKNVTINEPFFPGHFPGSPVMPGVLILEAMAQAAAILSFKTKDYAPENIGVVYFAGIDGARFRKPVKPGDQLVLKVDILRETRGIWKYAGRAEVDGETVAEAELMATLRDK
ncbi:3-hydroxyacyl-ACP dehydratase FabZ [Betaproteobacteria bacterium SCN1]|jgi:3-hydroxyacyl-[acyl-carrier-protein] dehydratase|nr:3-hydroxyacyl-ACP dehydratase FabZ [Betaproteobacteria bacterium SCN1]ODU90263.1 MAG: 3-hydroxyacyl-[acyl-carrier-protein] dehydratase FabZ [Thiobacillus sp. SCN 65-179]OJW34769.1 MAG: 3-hydroxyacyl-[acyl-carrier-protein] dehydratase FabZ [Thiobacillus sp. 65-69]